MATVVHFDGMAVSVRFDVKIQAWVGEVPGISAAREDRDDAIRAAVRGARELERRRANPVEMDWSSEW
jgi:hypothetical protein